MNEHNKWELVDFFNYNPLHTVNQIAVSSFSILVDQNTGDPQELILNVAIDRYLACCGDAVDFPVYIPADNAFHKPAHIQLLTEFRKGSPFVLVEPQNMKVCREAIGDQYNYIGTADNFRVIETQWLGNHRKDHI